MQTGLPIALLNPAIAAVLAAAFLALWTYQRARSFHLLLLTIGYAVSAVGFLLQYFSLPFASFAVNKLASCVAFTLAVVFITTAIQSRYVRRIPYAAIIALALGGIAGFSWFLVVDPDLTWRIYSMNFAFGGLCLLCAAELRPVRHEGPIQMALLWLTLLAAVNFLVRTLVAVALYGPFVSYDGFYTSTYWTTTQLAHAILSLMIALCLLTSTVIEMMGQLKAQSDTDPLSGLLNRRGFEERAAALLERSVHNNAPVALVLADLDHFKAVNDRYGHAAGDRVIIDFANKLRFATGARGIAGRIGGEEFAVILPLADLGAARLFAETVRTLFSTSDIGGFQLGTKMTASFGVAARSGHESLAPLMERADEALYKAKQSGRDSVRVSYLRLEMPFRDRAPVNG